MSGWVVPSQTRPAGVQLPPGLQIAATGSRVGAWLLDRVFFFCLALLLAGIAVVLGAVDISPAASDQMLAGTSANLVTVPLLTVNTNLLVLFGAIWVVIQFAYETVSWAAFRGTPGQRILSLRVADAATGHSLTIWRSTLRWLVLESVPQVALTVFLVLFVHMMGEVPPSVYGAGAVTSSLPPNSTYSTVSLAGDLAFLLSAGWRLALLVITTTHPGKRGLHDRVAGSVVVGKASAASYWAQSAYVGPGRPSAPFAAGPGFGPGYPYGPQATPPGQWPAPAGPETPPQGPTPGIWTPPGVPIESPRGTVSGQPGGQPELGEQPELGGHPRDPNSTWPPSEVGLPLAHRLADGTDLPAGLRVPEIPRRLAAYLIDCAIVYLFYIVWLNLLGSADTEKQAIVAGVIAGLGQLAYFVGSWRFFHGTLGQRMLSLQVGNVQTGNALAWGDAFVRWGILQGPFALSTVVPIALLPVVGLAAAGWSAFLLYEAYNNPDHRAVHDRAVQSLVAQTA